MEKEGYTNNLYQGGVSSFTPSYGDIFTGYNVEAGTLGVTTDPRTINLSKSASAKLATGAKQIELTLVTPEIFDNIAKQQLQEVHRLSKLTGSEVSVHAPVMDSSGLVPQQGFSEINREGAEKRMADILERSHEVDPRGNISVTFHSSEGLPGTQWETFDGERKAKRIIAVDKETGEMISLQTRQRYDPGEDLSKAQPSPPEKELEIANHSKWHNALTQLLFSKERADEILQQNQTKIAHLLDGINKGTIKEEDIRKVPEYSQSYNYLRTADEYLKDVHEHIRQLFSKAYEYGTVDQQKQLAKISEEFKKDSEGGDIMAQSKAMHVLLNKLSSRRDVIPEMYSPIDKFAAEKSSQSFGNAAFEAYKKFGTKAPVMNIENPPAGAALSTGEDLRNLVIKSREQFVKQAVESGKLSKSEAKAQAEKLIGATWDVGHINMLRRQGATEKDIIRETEKISPYVKHIHLSDNFGFEHTELPMGMGNVPLKEMMEKLPEKDIKKIIEVGPQWFQEYQTAPLKESLESMNAPIYSTGVGPFWSQTQGFYQDYISGMEGAWFPPQNFQMWGSGFSMASLPRELGGNMPGGGSRMGGTPME